MEHQDHPTDLLPAYALEILDPEELAMVEAHLANCPQCRTEVAALTQVVDTLALALPHMVAPNTVRERLVSEARRTPAPAVIQEPWWQKAVSPVRRFAAFPVWRFAAALLIILLLISNLYFIYRLQNLQSQSLNQQTIKLWGTDDAPAAGGLLLAQPGNSSGTLIVNGLPPLGPDQQYQLWLVRDETRISGAVFSVEGEGITSIPVNAPEELPSYTRFGITIEPTGGSPDSTGAAVLRSTPPDQ